LLGISTFKIVIFAFELIWLNGNVGLDSFFLFTVLNTEVDFVKAVAIRFTR